MIRLSAHRLAAIVCGLLAVASVGPMTASEQVLAPMRESIVAPDFDLQDLHGRVHRLSAYRGRVLVVNFWATWCPPCREEMPSLQRLWERLAGEGFEVLAINVGEDDDAIFSFTGSYPVQFPLLLDEAAAVIDSWPVLGLPTTFVVDTHGRLVYRAIGAREWDDTRIVDQIRRLLPGKND